MVKLKICELFAGIGGFRKGIEDAFGKENTDFVYISEWDKYAAQTYEKNFGHRPDTRSIRDVPTTDIPDHDLLVGGFPCQSFSVAGKRLGFEDTRGTLFFDIARILKAKQPAYFILENVKGLTNHDNGRTFKTILATITELGYDCQWQIVNSKNFGVPQNRERIFIIGNLRGKPFPQVFPIGGNDEAYQGKIDPQTANTLTANYWKGPGASRPLIRENPVVPTIRATQYKNSDNETLIVQKSPDWRKDGSLREYAEYSPTIRAEMGDNHPMVIDASYGNREPRVYKKITPTLRDYGSGGNKMPMVAQRVPLKFLSRNQKLIEGDYAYTIDGANTGGVMLSKTIRSGGRKSPHGSKQNWDSYEFDGVIRRLTPLECLRLQGFPDNWFDVPGLSDTQKYKQAGNAVTVNVVYEIAKRLVDFIKQSL